MNERIDPRVAEANAHWAEVQRETEQKKRRTTIWFVGVLVAFFACAAVVAVVSSISDVKGSFSAEGTTGTWTMTVDECASGDKRAFYGVDLTNKADSQRRIVISEDRVQGTEVRLEQRGRASIVFRGDACPDLSARLDTTGVAHGKANIRGMKGLMSIDCTVEGARLRGRAEFNNCP